MVEPNIGFLVGVIGVVEVLAKWSFGRLKTLGSPEYKGLFSVY